MAWQDTTWRKSGAFWRDIISVGSDLIFIGDWAGAYRSLGASATPAPYGTGDDEGGSRGLVRDGYLYSTPSDGSFFRLPLSSPTWQYIGSHGSTDFMADFNGRVYVDRLFDQLISRINLTAPFFTVVTSTAPHNPHGFAVIAEGSARDGLYIGSTGIGSTLSGGALLKLTAAGALSMLVAAPGDQFSSHPIFFDNEIYVVMAPNGRLYRYDGASSLVQVTGATPGGTPLGQTYALTKLNNRIYLGITNATGVTRGGQLWSWGPGETEWAVEATALGTYNSITRLIAHNGLLYALAQSPSESLAVFSHVEGAPPIIIPEYSAFCRNSSAKISHARTIRGYRTPSQTQNFHELMKEKTA
jgi:hypothetical protein